MMKLFITAGAIFFCTLTTQAFAECEPDRYGNIIDLGDGLCQSLPSEPFIEDQAPYWMEYDILDILNMPETEVLDPEYAIWFASTVSYQFSISNRWYFVQILEDSYRRIIDCSTGWFYYKHFLLGTEIGIISLYESDRESIRENRNRCLNARIPVSF